MKISKNDRLNIYFIFYFIQVKKSNKIHTDEMLVFVLLGRIGLAFPLVATYMILNIK